MTVFYNYQGPKNGLVEGIILQLATTLILVFGFSPYLNAQIEIDSPSDCPNQIVFELIDKDLQIGDVFCEKVFVYGFTNIEAFSFSIIWNQNAFRFDRCDESDLVRGCEFGSLNQETGTFSIVWSEGIGNPIDLINQSPLLTLCFEVIGDPFNMGTIELSNDPVAIEIVNGANTPVEYCIITGTKRIDCEIFKAYQRGCSYGNEENTFIEFLTCGGRAPYSYLILQEQHVVNSGTFVKNFETIKINGLNPNLFYSIRVIDALNNVYEEELLIDVTDELELRLEKVNPTCVNGRTSIKSEVTGGKEPYFYHWNNTLLNINEINNLDTGTYVVGIRDINGCSVSGKYFLNGVQNYLTLDNDAILHDYAVWQASQNISSLSALNGNNTVEYKAGNSIELLPGFSVSNGTVFEALIEDCIIDIH